ncbi:MAG: WbqC family protein [Betaproteobacteria bacterium]|nr:WbqC family protein [Betaproteobacteria bacterium]
MKPFDPGHARPILGAARTIAVMQPYFLPYLGYWQLLHAADTIVLLDDVAYMPRGWVNRNRILANGMDFLFTIPVLGSSQNRRICDIERDDSARAIPKLASTLQQSYRRAACCEESYPIIHDCLNQPATNLADFNVASIRRILDSLGISREIKRSSAHFSHLSSRGEERILDICTAESATRYLNLPGGVNLYVRENFAARGIDLKFIRPVLQPYSQLSDTFVPGLSIVDALLNIGIDSTRRHVQLMELVDAK